MPIYVGLMLEFFYQAINVILNFEVIQYDFGSIDNIKIIHIILLFIFFKVIIIILKALGIYPGGKK